MKAVSCVIGGEKLDSVAKRVGVTPRCLSGWLAKFKSHKSLEDKPRSGRPRKRTKDFDARVRRHSKGKKRGSNRAVAKRISTEIGERVSRESVRRSVKEQRLYPHRPQRKPKLKARDRSARVQFARKFLKWQPKFWLFEDEKRFSLYPRPNIKNDVVWDSKGVTYFSESVKWPGYIRVAGAVSYYGKTELIEYPADLNAEQYQSILGDWMIPAAEKMFGDCQWTLVQDGDPAHRALSTQQYLEENVPRFIKAGEWPANSPDLNIQENVWADLAHAVASRQPSTVKQLRKYVQEEWKKYPQQKIRNMVDSYKDRLHDVIACEGGNTKW